MLLRRTIATLLAAAVFGISGCLLMDHRKGFEAPKNRAVGQRVSDTVYRKPHWLTKHATYLEYGFKDPRGCSWMLEVDLESTVVRSWHYLSDPKLCWTHVPTADTRTNPLLSEPVLSKASCFEAEHTEVLR